MFEVVATCKDRARKRLLRAKGHGSAGQGVVDEGALFREDGQLSNINDRCAVSSLDIGAFKRHMIVMIVI